MYTTNGLMTAADLYDQQLLTDMHVHPDCPGHEDDDGTAFCRAADDCPGEQGLTEAGDCMVDNATGWCATHKRYEA